MYSLIFKTEPGSDYRYENVVLESNLVETKSEDNYKIYKPNNRKYNILAVKNNINEHNIKVLYENRNIVETSFYDLVEWSSDKHIDICTKRHKKGGVKLMCKGTENITKEISKHRKEDRVVSIVDLDIFDERIYISPENISFSITNCASYVNGRVFAVSDTRDVSNKYTSVEYIRVDIGD